MSTILVKIFATALTLSQVTVQPDNVRTSFDPQADKPRVEQILKDGCAHLRRAFDIEDINLDELISTAMEDPQAIVGEVKVLQGISFSDLHVSYRQFCNREKVVNSPVDLGAVISYYNTAVADLPDHGKLKGMRLPGLSVVLDGNGQRFTEVFEPDHRRVWVPVSDIPHHVQAAFIAAEDKRFAQHRGIDERGVIRAFVENMAAPGRPQGGSTISQQVAKNLLVGDDVTYERKMREMIVAARMEQTLSKREILELYLNAIYLGRSSWGIEMAARSYFGKSAKALTLEEGALLAALTKGPNYYNPDRHPQRVRERMAYVLTRMQETGRSRPRRQSRRSPHAATRGLRAPDPEHRLPLRGPPRPRRPHGGGPREPDGPLLYGAHHSEPRPAAGDGSCPPRGPRPLRAQHGPPAVHRRGEEPFRGDREARSHGRRGRAGLAAGAEERAHPALRRALAGGGGAREGKDKKTNAEFVRVGLEDGRIVSLSTWNAAVRRALKVHDVVHVRVAEATQKTAARAELRVRPSVQGTAVVLENKTGRILAMAGGFSYPLSQLNRSTQAHRQPGSALKPITYLAALGAGLQPNTLVWDAPLTLPPVGGAGSNTRAKDYWTPKNYDGGGGGLMTLRRALENSKNLVTARLLDGGIADEPERSLNRICELALEAQLYVECVRHYPFILGAQPVRPLDLAAFYAAIANEGARPSPYAIEAVDEAGRPVYRRKAAPPIQMGSADKAAFFQLKTICKGCSSAAPPPASASSRRTWPVRPVPRTTRTTSGSRVYQRGQHRGVGRLRQRGRQAQDARPRQTGGKVALPIFEKIVEAAWQHHAPPHMRLAPPVAGGARQLIAAPIDVRSGERAAGAGAFTEYFRKDWFGRVADTQYRLVPRSEAYAFRDPDGRRRGGRRLGHGRRLARALRPGAHLARVFRSAQLARSDGRAALVGRGRASPPSRPAGRSRLLLRQRSHLLMRSPVLRQLALSACSSLPRRLPPRRITGSKKSLPRWASIRPAQAQDGGVQRSPQKTSSPTRSAAHLLRGLDPGTANPEAASRPVPLLRRADHQRQRPWAHQALQGEAPRLRGRRPLPRRQAAVEHRRLPLRAARRDRGPRPLHQAPAHLRRGGGALHGSGKRP
jgi:membrane carboxypeptidase/penicillin-binding protein